MPELTWDDTILVQSNAITRFVAREVGIAGKNNVEMAQCDAVGDFCAELAEGKLQCVCSMYQNLASKISLLQPRYR